MPYITLQDTGARDLCPVSLMPDRYPRGTGIWERFIQLEYTPYVHLG